MLRVGDIVWRFYQDGYEILEVRYIITFVWGSVEYYDISCFPIIGDSTIIYSLPRHGNLYETLYTNYLGTFTASEKLALDYIKEYY